jgi:hypothetical protein
VIVASGVCASRHSDAQTRNKASFLIDSPFQREGTWS